MDIEREENKRTISLKSGNKLICTRTDPYGFWSISFERGAVPNELKGSYTTFNNAMRAIELWVERSNKEVGDPDPIPELKYKKVKKQTEDA